MIRYLPSFVFLIIFSLLNNLDANLVSPQNNSQLNYTHVLFEWNQIPGADSYNLYKHALNFITLHYKRFLHFIIKATLKD